VTEPGGLRGSLLRRNRQLRILVTARVLSFAGDQLTTVALTLLVHQRYGLGRAVSVLLVAQVVPQLAGPLAGAIVDRAHQRRVV
jgi:MFS family permease